MRTRIAVALVVALAGCADVSKPPSGVTRANGNGCYELADAVMHYNKAFNGVKNGTVTVSDAQKELAATVKNADQASVDLSPGDLKLQADMISLHAARARVAIDSTGYAMSMLVEDPAVEEAFLLAAKSCPGIFR